MIKTKLQKAFNESIDGANANLIQRVIHSIFKQGLINGIDIRRTITLGELVGIMQVTAEKQEKDIEKYLNN